MDGLKPITRLRVALIGVAVAALLITTLSTRATAAAAGSSLTGSRPAWAAKATDLGALRSSQRVDFQVMLAVRNAAAAEQEVAAVSTPGSSTFHQFLTDAQFDARFAPSAATEAVVAAWLRSAGLTVVSVASSRMYVEVQGTVAQADRLLGTSLHNYRYQGQTLAAPTANYLVPAQLRTAIAGIVGLDGSHATTAGTIPGPPPGARYGVQPCSAYYGQKVATSVPSAYGQQWPYTICGYSAAQYQEAFGLAELDQRWEQWPWGDGRHHGRLRRADHPRRRQHVVEAGGAPDADGALQSDHTEVQRVQRAERVRTAGLVR